MKGKDEMEHRAMPPGETQDRARQIVNGLAGLDARDALQVLASALQLVLSQSHQDSGTLRRPVKGTAPRLLRRRGGVSKISQDPELKAFLDSLDQPTTLRELRKTLIQQFGAARVPSKSALHRYMYKMAAGNAEEA